MSLDCKRAAFLAALLLLSPASPSARAVDPGPGWLPRYEVGLNLDLDNHCAYVQLRATWTNPEAVATGKLVFNAHSRYIVPEQDVGLTAKTLELLRLDPSTSLGIKKPVLDVQRISLLQPSGPAVSLKFDYEGDTKTALVVPLPHAVRQGESVTVLLEMVLNLPAKQGRWGQWHGITTLCNWLPVFAYYGVCKDHKPANPAQPREAPPVGPPQGPPPCDWEPTPFIPWHQPFFNEAGHYRVRATLPADQVVACTGTVVGSRRLGDGRQELDIYAPGVRDFAFLCSSKYKVFEDVVEQKVPPVPAVVPTSAATDHSDTLPAPRPVPSTPTPVPEPPPSKVRIHVLAFPEHEFYAREMVRIVSHAIATYSKWFGPYPWPDFTIAESFFGWNGNECSTLVMIDERIFSMPHLAAAAVDSLVSHETCHQWWYNLVGTNGYCETWMDEGLATYFSHRLLDEKVGRNNDLMKYPRGLAWLPNIRRDDYRSYGMYGALGRGDNSPLVQPMSSFSHVNNLFSMCYDKGHRVVGLIEDRLGSAAFLDFMRRVLCRYRYRILRVADFQRELEEYTGRSWEKFFQEWIYGPGLTDWCVRKVRMNPTPCAQARQSSVRVEVLLEQKNAINEPTVLGIAVPGQTGYPIRIPIVPQAGSYQLEDPPAQVETEGENKVRVQVYLPAEPKEIAVDPDQVLVDRNPANNFWKTPIRYRFTPAYTMLEETDITTAYDRWTLIAGPWLYGTAYYDPWYTRTTGTLIGMRAGLYRPQVFDGGVYSGYRTDYRDFVVGVDGIWDHWPGGRLQFGFNAEQRLFDFYNADQNARRAVLYSRYIFKYGSSLYLPPMEFVEGFTAFQDNFLPFDSTPSPDGVRWNHTATGGVHYRQDYLTPYWNPEGGYRFDLWTEAGEAAVPVNVGMGKISSQLSAVKSLPDFSNGLEAYPWLYQPLHWLGDSRLALRAYGGTSFPGRGEFFTMGGSYYFRAFDLAQRQGSTVWVGSVEWRLPVLRDVHWDVCDHVFGLRNADLALFYDIGDVYTDGHSVGPVAQGVGASFRLDVAWFSFVERTLLRFDIAKAVNVNSGVQMWFGVGVPF
jgi:hypothetical protein